MPVVSMEQIAIVGRILVHVPGVRAINPKCSNNQQNRELLGHKRCDSRYSEGKRIATINPSIHLIDKSIPKTPASYASKDRSNACDAPIMRL
jgi:hypothetical protein